MKRLSTLVVALVPLLMAIACGGDGGSSPTTPTPSAPAPPVQATFSLTGHVTESEPTTEVNLGGVHVEFVDGSNAGKSAGTDGAGNYVMTTLQPGGFSVRASKVGYETLTLPLALTIDRNLDFQLNPVAKTFANTIKRSISGGSSTCDDGFDDRPCYIIDLPVHHAGTIDATLRWTGTDNDLDLGLNSPTRFIASSRNVTQPEHVSAVVDAHVMYQFRITYYRGDTIANFTLTYTRPN